MRQKYNRAMTIFAIGAWVGGGLFAANARAETDTTAASNSASRENDSVNVRAEHHYNSPAERANDALLITEVKSALAVDCDHGKVLLSGVVKSAEDARHAGDVAAAAQGVTGVKNQLTWH